MFSLDTNLLVYAHKVFDIALVATLKDHGISGIYTANTTDFEEFDFLEVVNPLDR